MDAFRQLEGLRGCLPAGDAGRSAARVDLSNLPKSCCSGAARGSLSTRLSAYLPRWAAALHGILGAAWRTSNDSCRGGQRALQLAVSGQPNKAMQPTAGQRAFHPRDLSGCLGSPRRLIAGVRLLASDLKRARDWPLAHSARLIASSVGCFLPRRAAALRGILHATWRGLSSPFQGRRRELKLSTSGQPNNSLQRSAGSAAFIRRLGCLIRCARAR